jgi:hypothetical protein
MTYRKIEVDGKEYEYTIGKTHTKIKGVGVFLNEDIGNVITTYRDGICECCGSALSEIYPNRYPVAKEGLAVRPHDIMRKIRGK